VALKGITTRFANPTFTGTGGSGYPIILAQSSAAVSGAADTNENALATITVPAGAMGVNGRLRITALWTVNNNANAKTARIRFSGASGTEYTSLNLASQASFSQQTYIANRGAANSQVGPANNQTFGGWAATGTAVTTSAVDTTAATTVVISGQKATAGDTMTLESYLVELIKP
jgi:hypothetical protein